ncbi:MAG: amino acid permease [Candidatus Omnitrophota bacterium]|jgi:amino acid transporter/mannitol/fructose-specific phosphotransferase system IIA component (Ntr-type)
MDAVNNNQKIIQEKLKRGLGLLDVFCIASGAMISSGLFVLPGIASAKVGSALFISYILASIMSVPTMLSKAELVTAMPRAGGDYFYISRSMGFAVGIIGGLGSWFSFSFKGAFALIGMAAYVELVANIPIKIVALCLCLLFIVLNLIGIKGAARTQVIIVLTLFATLLFYVIFGFPSIHIQKYVPFAPQGIAPIFATAGLIFISYGGLTKVASVAEEVRNPGRNIPLGMILSLIIVGIFYALVVFITTGLLTPDKLHFSLTPISDGARTFAGIPGMIIMAVAGLLAFISTANAAIMSASRYPMAMSRDKLLPSFLETVNNRFKTPHYSILFTGIFMVSAILFLELELLVKVASALLLLLYILTNFAVIIMRESKIQNYQPQFRSPLYPIVQILGILGCGFLLAGMGKLTLSLSGIFIIAGLFWYLVYAGLKVEKEYALIHVIERIINKELTSGILPKELKGILRERDNIVEDRFDHLIKDSAVMDLENALTADEFFSQVGSFLAEDLQVDAAKLTQAFIKREKESSTVIRPGLAIPHIIVPGERKFKILLVRAKQGISFAQSAMPVHTVFVLAGTKDERNFHLRALAAIAQICQQHAFDSNWMSARNKEALRDIILLAERKRFGTI